MDELRGLQEWYASQCDGDWEHGWGVRIGTLDNPGWTVQINLAETELEGVPYTEISDLTPERDWVRTWVEGTEFHGVGGPHMLAVILRQFLAWAGSVRRAAV
jgi:hypothetical protein